ncbi:MAG: glycosyltransferase [Desulfovibrio sp.]|nr:glycosyltransferase [Desulfovibrio sp.]
MKIFYYLSSYISHLTAGLEYLECLRALGHDTRGNIAEGADAPASLRMLSENDDLCHFARQADTVILHDDPLNFENIFAALPFLEKKRCIAFVPWENELLSPLFIPFLQRVNEVWTCSEFSLAAIAPHVHRCALLPHLVRRAGKADLPWYRAWLSERGAQDDFIFLSVLDAVNPRKNLRGLLTAFSMLHRHTRKPVRLLVKQYRVDLDVGSVAGVLNLPETLPAERMAALYAGCGAYVSAHHAEGWGLGLSSAMAYGKPVIATAYSGNMQFMNERNSILIPYVTAPVSEEMIARIPLFTADMRWAEPDMDALVEAMRRAAEGRLPPDLPAHAVEITRTYGPKRIRARLQELLNKRM